MNSISPEISLSQKMVVLRNSFRMLHYTFALKGTVGGLLTTRATTASQDAALPTSSLGPLG